MRISKMGLYLALFSALTLCFGCENPYVNDPVASSNVGIYAAADVAEEDTATQITGETQDEGTPETLAPEMLAFEDTACASDTGYSLGPEDILQIQIFNEQDLSGDYQINAGGMIDMPLIGELSLAGCTLPQAEALIYAGYTDGYLVEPSISIEIKNYRPFFIIGEVRAPGKYDFAADMTILKAAALAGGFTYRANRKIARVAKHSEVKIDTDDDPVHYEDRDIEEFIRPGEVIIIKERLF